MTSMSDVGALMALIGSEIAKMHLANIIHGDLTTSNMILRHPFTPHTENTSLVRLLFFDAPERSDYAVHKGTDRF